MNIKELLITFNNFCEEGYRNFSVAEKSIFGVLFIVFAFSAGTLFARAYSMLLLPVPQRGGTVTEGIVGTPRFINPLLAISDSDKDLSALVYSGLMKATPSGELTEDLAEGYILSDDGKTYTFTLKSNLLFQDGEPLTAHDIAFTILKAQDPMLKSPKRAAWEGVTVTVLSDSQIQFTLKQAYTPFLENTTLGILPEHIWKHASSEEFAFSEYNINPVGSGPFIVTDVARNSGGIPTEYTLKPFDDYALGAPYIQKFVFKTYSNEQDLANAFVVGDIDSMYTSNTDIAKSLTNDGFSAITPQLPRVFGLFFNQNQNPIFLYTEVRKALSYATDRQELIDSALSGFATPIDGPIPPRILDTHIYKPYINTATSTDAGIAAAINILERNGWKKNPDTGIYEKTDNKTVHVLSFSISTGNIPALKKTAEILKTQWEKIGAQVDIKVFETGDLNPNIIRPRKYDALLFGMIVGRDKDLYSFWHSSQRNDPGLNVSLYANSDTDKALETIRSSNDKTKVDISFKTLVGEIKNDIPAIFLYAPSFTYFVHNDVYNIQSQIINTPSERFLNVNEWYKYTNSVLPFFTSLN